MLVVPSSSEAEAVIPTVVPASAFSVTVFEVPSVSEGPETSNSSTSFTLMVTYAESESPEASAAVYATTRSEYDD